MTLLSLLSLRSYAHQNIHSVFEKNSSKVVGVFSFNGEDDSENDSEDSPDVFGTGFFYSSKCLIITNHHVVSNSNKIGISMYKKTKGLTAKVIGSSSTLDVAVLEPTPPLKTCEYFTPSKTKIKVGDEVYALGNPVGFERTLSAGIVSALNRSVDQSSYHRMIQTDASIYPGNSGGPLVTKTGKLIGLITLGMKEGSGLSFALPVDLINNVLPELKRYKGLKKRKIGITASQHSHKEKLISTDYMGGIRVKNIQKNSVASLSGLKKDDLIYSAFDGKRLNTINDLEKELYSYPLGSYIKLNILRNNKAMSISLEIKAE